MTFPAYRQNDAVGHITLSKNWNGYTLIDEIAVSADARRQGIAGALLDYAKQWARQQETSGMMLETQNNNGGLPLLPALWVYPRRHRSLAVSRRTGDRRSRNRAVLVFAVQ